MDLLQAAQTVAATLKAHDLPATVDAALADLPGAVVFPGQVRFPRLSDTFYEFDVDVLLVARGVPGVAALDQLSALLDKFRAAFPEVGQFDSVLAVLPSQSPDPLPALRATIPLSVTVDDESE